MTAACEYADMLIRRPATSFEALDAMQAALRKLGDERDLQQIYTQVVQQAGSLFGVSQSSLLLYDEVSGTLRLHQPDGGPDNEAARHLASLPAEEVAHLFANWPAHGARRLVDDNHHGPADFPLATPLPEGTVLMALVHADDQLIGALTLAGKSDGSAFTEDDEHLAGFYASQVGLLIEGRQRLAREERARHLAELATLQEISLAVTAYHDVARLMQTIVKKAVDLLEAAGGAIGQIDHQNSQVRFMAEYNLEPSMLGSSVRLGEGIAGFVAQTGQPLVVADYATWPGRLPDVWPRPRGALAAVPLRWQEQVIGVLIVFGGRSGSTFDQEDVNLLSLFADQAASALENARLFEQMQTHLQAAERRSRELALVNQVTTAINSVTNVNDLLNLILGELEQLLHFGRASISLLEGSNLVIVGMTGFPPDAELIGRRYPIKRFPLNETVIETGKAIFIPDVLADPRWIKSDTYTLVRAWMGVPLAYGGKVIGLLTLTVVEPTQYTRDDVQLVMAVAEQAALAIEKARLLDGVHRHLVQAERRSEELATINRISSDLSASLDLDTILRSTVAKLAHVTGVAQAGLVLFDWQKGCGRLVAEYQQHPNESGRDARIPVKDNLSLARVLATRAPLVIVDAQNDLLMANVRDVMVQRGVKSILLLPLIVRGEVIGTIGLDELERQREFTATEVELAQTITNQAATAIANAQLYEDVKRRAFELQTIQEVTGRISTILDPDELLAQVADLIAERCGYYQVHVFLVDESGEYLVAHGINGPSGREMVAAGVRLKIGGGGLCSWAASHGQAVVVGDVTQDERYVTCAGSNATRSEIVVPMKASGNLIGLIDAQSTDQDAFDDADRFLIATMADQVAIALENARLYKTLQERAQQLAGAYEELKVLDRMKDEFVQTVSHELRTPLTFIKGYVELLLEEVMGDLNEEQKDALKIVAQRAENVISLVNDIISLTRPDSMALSLQPVDLGDLALNAVQGAQAVTGQAGIELRMAIEGQLPLVMADPQRLSQVFDNLVGNAIKFSPDGGSIWVRLKLEDKAVRIEVADQGIGIPSDKLERIWERFYQVDSTTTRRFGGTGLGLAIVKRLVEAHGGQVGVTSTVGEGSTFYFSIPRSDL